MEEIKVEVSQIEKSDSINLQETVTSIIAERLDDTAQIIRTWLLEEEREKAAILLVAVGSEISSEIIQHLREDEIETLTFDIARLDLIETSKKDAVLQEFHELITANRYIYAGGIDFARDLLEKALGAQKTIDIINRLTSSLQVRPFDFVRRTYPLLLHHVIQSERPQTIALILTYLEPEKAAVILENLPGEIQSEIIRRITTMNSISPGILRAVERTLESKLAALSIEDYCSSGGVENAAEILNMVDRAKEKQILETLKENDPQMAEEIEKNMLAFKKLEESDE